MSTERNMNPQIPDDLRPLGNKLVQGFLSTPAEVWPLINRITTLTSQHESDQETIARLENTYRCFHCGFESFDPVEIQAHFGEVDDGEEFKPICKWYSKTPEAERMQLLQDYVRDWQKEQERAERAEVQLAGCGAAALGWSPDAKQGDYGWSASYADVVKIRTELTQLRETIAKLKDPAIVHTNILRGTIALTREQAIHIAGLPADVEDQLIQIREENARLKAPVSDEEWNSSEVWGRVYRHELDALIASRAKGE